MGMRKIESQEEQFPDRVAEEKAGQEEQPYLRTTDVNPRIHFMAPEGMDSERAKKFEDAFTRKMVNEVGDPSLPKVPPRGQSPQAPVPTQAAPQGPAVSAPTPEGVMMRSTRRGLRSGNSSLRRCGPTRATDFTRTMPRVGRGTNRPVVLVGASITRGSPCRRTGSGTLT